jgi:WD40-like Beta Propeller Repeat
MNDGLDPVSGMDRTTLLLHRRTEALPAVLPRPGDVRARAERERRARRATAGGILAVVAAVAVMTGGGPGRDKSEPIVSPAPRSLGPLAYGLNGDIYVADADGSNSVRIANGAPGIVRDCPGYWGEGPIWSPDGRYLAYRGHVAADDTDCYANRTVNISDAAGHRVASFPGEGWAISWSPDSTRVAAWVDFYPGTKIGIYGLDGRRQALLTVPPRFSAHGDYDPVWSPDGTSLLLPHGGVIPVDGSTPRQLPADDPRTQWNARYSPDGADIAYITQDGLAVAAADGSQARVLVPGCIEGYTGGPPGLAWSPTGDRIAFAFETCEKGQLRHTTELSVVDVASGTVVSLADLSGAGFVQGSLKFSPKGDQILFASRDTDANANAGTSSLWSVHADGSDPHLLVAGTSWGDWQREPDAPRQGDVE